MNKPRIHIAIPCYNHMNVQCRHSLDIARHTCQTALTEVHYAVGDSMISRVRNNQVSEFYEQDDADWYMTIDSDLVLQNNTAEDNLFDKMLAHGEMVVGGLYAKKEAGGKFRCASVPMDDKMPEYDSGLIEMQWLSTGCMLVNREVIRRMIEASPELVYHGDGKFLFQPRYALYQPGIAEIDHEGKPFRKYLSEDWAFNLRCHQIGVPTYADTTIRLIHMGEFGYKLWDV